VTSTISEGIGATDPVRRILIAGPDLATQDWDIVFHGRTVEHRRARTLSAADLAAFDEHRQTLIIAQFSAAESNVELRWCEAVAPHAFLPVVVCAGRAEIGPLSGARPGSCSRCRLMRGLATAPDYAAERAALIATTARGDVEPLARPAVGLLMGALSAEVQRVLDHSSPVTHNAVLSADFDAVTISRHRLAPVPGCPTCNLRTSAIRSSAEATGASFALFDPEHRRYGQVQDLRLEHVPPWEPQVRIVSATLAREITPSGADVGRQRRVFGCALDLDTAVASAIGEAIERLAGCDVRPRPPALRPARDDSRVDLSPIPRWSEPELRRLGDRYHRDLSATTDWVAGRRLGDNVPVLVPAQLVYCPYHPVPPERLAWEPTTTGLAVGQDRPETLLRGLLEVIERDALACAWLLHRPAASLDAPTVMGERWPRMRQQLLRGGLRLSLGLVPSDLGAVVVVARLVADGGPISTSFGSAAALSLEAAAVKAVVEACLVRHTLLTRITIEPPRPTNPRVAEPVDFHEHGLAWMTADPAASDWLFDSAAVAAVPPLAKGLHELVQRVHTAGYQPLGADLVTPAFASGWHAVRVVVPGLQPLNPGRHKVMTDSPRLRRVAGLAPDRKMMPLNIEVHPWC